MEQGIHDRGLAGIGVTDQSHLGQTRPQPSVALRRALPLDHFQFPPELRQPLFNPAAVQFQFLLASALIGQTPAASALTGEGGTHADQTRQHILELGGFHLKLGLPRPGPGGKNLQDQACPVNDFRIQLLFQVAHLHGRQSLVKNNDIRVLFFDDSFQLLDLAAAYIGGVRDLGCILDKDSNNSQIAGVRQPLQLRHGAGMFFRRQIHAAAHQNGPGLPVLNLYTIYGFKSHGRITGMPRAGTAPSDKQIFHTTLPGSN